jgi:hypothetical protein
MMELLESQFKIQSEEHTGKSPSKKDEEISILKAQIEATALKTQVQIKTKPPKFKLKQVEQDTTN